MADQEPPILTFDLPRMLALWKIDERTRQVLHTERTLVQTAIAGHEAEFVEAVLAGDSQPHLEKARRREALALAGLWHALLGGELDEAHLMRAAAAGRQFLALGIEGRNFLAASQRVMKRVMDALLAAPPAERDAAIDAATRVMLLTADVTLTAYYETVAGAVSERLVHRETEQLHEQVKALEELAHVDGLTRLYNRRHLDDALAAEIARAERTGQPLALALADLDGLKAINEAHGQAAGDLVLAHVAGLMRETARRSDVLARYGGDSFALVLTGTTSDNAARFAGRLRSVIATRPVPPSDGAAIPVTISVGIAAFNGNESAASLLARADGALARAKANGRDRVER